MMQLAGHNAPWADYKDVTLNSLAVDTKAYSPIIQISQSDYAHDHGVISGIASSLKSLRYTARNNSMHGVLGRAAQELVDIVDVWADKMHHNGGSIVYVQTMEAVPFVNEPSVGVHSHDLYMSVTMLRRDHEAMKLIIRFGEIVLDKLRKLQTSNEEIFRVPEACDGC